FSSRRRHTRFSRDWSSDVCSSDLLPLVVTSFVGRRRELDEVKSLLENTHVVTLTGPGGTGKSRLALQVGAESVGSFPDGVFFVDLAPITDPDLLPSEVLTSLGLEIPQRTDPATPCSRRSAPDASS